MCPGDTDIRDLQGSRKSSHPVCRLDSLSVVSKVPAVIIIYRLQLFIVAADDLDLPFHWCFSLNELIVVGTGGVWIIQRPVLL